MREHSWYLLFEEEDAFTPFFHYWNQSNYLEGVLFCGLISNPVFHNTRWKQYLKFDYGVRTFLRRFSYDSRFVAPMFTTNWWSNETRRDMPNVVLSGSWRCVNVIFHMKSLNRAIRNRIETYTSTAEYISLHLVRKDVSALARSARTLSYICIYFICAVYINKPAIHIPHLVEWDDRVAFVEIIFGQNTHSARGGPLRIARGRCIRMKSALA